MIEEHVVGPFRQRFGIAEDAVVDMVADGPARAEIELPHADVARFYYEAEVVGTSFFERSEVGHGGVSNSGRFVCHHRTK